MTDRTQLVRLLNTIFDHNFHPDVVDMVNTKLLADHLIANGVTLQKWIPVTERLPGVFKAVIVWTKFHEIGEAQHNGKCFVWIDDEGAYDYAHVTHWMPLPEPPKED